MFKTSYTCCICNDNQNNNQNQQQQQQRSNNFYQNVRQFKRSLLDNEKPQIFPQLFTYNPAIHQQQQQFNNNKKEIWSTSDRNNVFNKRRICIVTTEIEGPVLGGGIGTAYTALSQKLQEDGHNVTILLVNQVKKLSPSHWKDLYQRKGIQLIILDFQQQPQQPSQQQQQIKSINTSEGIGIVGCTGPCIRSYKTFQWLSQYDESFDIIHFHDNGGMGYFSVLSKKQGLFFRNSIFVIGGHGPHLWERTANSANLDDGKHFEVDFLERKSVEMADWLISPSNYMLNWMKYNGWNLPQFSYVHQNLLPGKNQFESDGDQDIPMVPHKFSEIIFFGRLEARKGLDIFMRALDKLSSVLNDKKITITFLGSNTKLTEINMMADKYIVSRCNHKLNINCNVLIGKSHSEAIEYLTTNRESKLVVVASPIDNSPNTVLESLTNQLALVATKVGGIPELIHPEDRDRVLFLSNPSSLVKKISSLLETGIHPARFAIDEWTRQRIWGNWHSIVNIQQQETKPNTIDKNQVLDKRISIVLVYHDNFESLSKALQSVISQVEPHWNLEVVLACSTFHENDPNNGLKKAVNTLKNRYLKKLETVVISVSEHLVSPYQIWNSETVLKAATGDLILFVDLKDYLSTDAIRTLLNVAQETDADILSGSVQNSETLKNVVSVYMGCVGLPGIMYNCYGSNNLMIKREPLFTISKKYPDDYEYDLEWEYGGTWEFYAQSTNYGFTLETIPKNIFISDKLEIDIPSTYNQELRVMKHFEDILPPTFELAPIATRHFLTSKSIYVNEIINSNLRSKELSEKCLKMEQNQPGTTTRIISEEDGSTFEHHKEVVDMDRIGLVFIRGHEKSGTSWLKKVLKLHPKVSMANNEFHFHFLEEAIDKFTKKPWQASKEPYLTYTKKWYKSFVRDILLSSIHPTMAPLYEWVGEKTPSPLAPIISGSRYVLIVRDGRDVVVSLFWHYVRLGGFENWCGPTTKYLVEPEHVSNYKSNSSYFYDHPEKLLEKEICFRAIAKSWAKRVKSDQDVITQLEKEPVAQVHVIQYEELHRNPEDTRMKMYNFLDLDYGEAEPLSIDDKTLPGGFKEDGSESNKFFRKGEIGDWKNYFTPDNKKWFKEEAGHILIDLGYEINNDW
eukprot:gene9339-11453_t